MKPFFITTAIDYTNGAPHIGHAYEKILADVIARTHRLRGEEVFLLTGVDQHGQKVQQSAEAQGVPPQQFVAEITAKFRALWDKLSVSYDAWAATTDPVHKDCVRTILQRLWDEGQLYKDKRGGYYSVRQEQFLTDKERGPDGEFGPEWGQVEFREEENYYFPLAEHKQWLLDLIRRRSDQGRPLVVPDFRVAELLNAVEKLEGDLCVSRPKSRLTWGIELPFDPGYVTYVWFDALVNYISFAPGFNPKSKIQNPKFHSHWPALHVIGKDILIPAHGEYWPIMLKAIGFSDDDIPTLLVHGWWNISGAKMSKSLGNIIDPDALADKYGAAALRYYLMSDITTGRDADFNEDRLISRYNTDLANGLGNLLNRTLNMAHKYRAGKLDPIHAASADITELRQANAIDTAGFCARLDEFQVHLAIEHFNSIVTRANSFIDRTAPWQLARDPNNTARLNDVLFAIVESIRCAASLLAPVAPESAQAVFQQLQLDPIPLNGPFDLETGIELQNPTPVFPRIETASAQPR